MPLGRHKVPFSNKQKKLQLQQKRDKKRNVSKTHGESSTGYLEKIEADDHTEDAKSFDQSKIHKLNQQPGIKGGTFDTNRYRLHFFKESKEELQERKQLAYLPVKLLSEDTLEVDLDDVFLPGSELDMPKRPKWSYKMSKEQIDAQERKYFQDYLAALEGRFALRELSYFEVNLETWRQLWRVLEMSDIIFIIVDIRFPALLFSPVLYHHITSEMKKEAVIILNKIDLVPPSLVVAWKHYFKERFPAIHVIYFTSFSEKPITRPNASQKLQKSYRRKRHRMAAESALRLHQVCDSIVAGKVDLRGWHEKIASELDSVDDDDSTTVIEGQVTVEELDTSFCEYERFRDRILTLGCVGQPNVGKSSVINALVGKKVVSVSRTPGHTKHFQTIFLTNNVRLCDCPGLVFPSKVPKPLQVLAGSYPIAQLQDPYSSVRYIMEHMPLPRLLAVKHPYPEGGEKEAWSAFDVCEAWAEKRGFRTARAARNDTYRAANHLLRMALEGRICIYLRPPGYSSAKDKWETHEDVIEIKKNFLKMSDEKNGDDGVQDAVQLPSDEEESAEEDRRPSSSDEEGGSALDVENKFLLLAND